MESFKPSPSHSPSGERAPPSPVAGEGRKSTPALPLALILTVLLTAWWTALAWADLGALRLPEADDMVRLVQIRDWLDGQSFADPVQARIGPLGGTALHWSRLPDIVPAGLIWLLSPLLGVTRAEIAAVIFWPELLFFLHLLLAGALARRLGGNATIAATIAIAALAFPAIGLFMPGRIDHHGLQIVLAETMLLGLLGGRVLLAGAAAGASLLVGLETAPMIGAAMLWLGIGWVVERRSVAGFGIGLIGAALFGLVALKTQPWPADRCDSFTPPVLAAMLAGGVAWLLLAGLAPRLPDRRWRAGALLAIGAATLAVLWIAAPSCFASPYGLADPLVARAWPEQPGELGGLLRQSLGTAIAWLALPLLGLSAAIFLVARTEDRRGGWMLLALLIGVMTLAAFAQMRTLWFAAALAPPALAAMVLRARRKGVAPQIGALLLSAGLVWQTLGALIDGGKAEPGCADRATLAGLDRLETGSFAAPLDLGAALVGATQHRSLGGPYHRNVVGNRALARFLLATPEEARYEASLWGIDYVALCPTATGGLTPGLLAPSGLAAHLVQGAAPDWLDPVPLIGSDTLVWRVRPIAGLPVRP